MSYLVIVGVEIDWGKEFSDYRCRKARELYFSGEWIRNSLL